MDKGSQAERDERNAIRGVGRQRGTSADEIIAGTRSYARGYGERSAGMKPGTYVVSCDWCQGRPGLMRRCGTQFETCHKCHGTGTLTVNGERHGDKAKRKEAWQDFKDGLLYMGIVVLILTGIVVAIITRAKAW
jgi:hypothetical protein